MGVPLRGDLVLSLIKRRFQSIDGLVAAWVERVDSRIQKVGKARDRATIYHWLDKGLPSTRHDLFGFAAVLDVDPVALLDLSEEYIKTSYGRGRRPFPHGLADRKRVV